MEKADRVCAGVPGLRGRRYFGGIGRQVGIVFRSGEKGEVSGHAFLISCRDREWGMTPEMKEDYFFTLLALKTLAH